MKKVALITGASSGIGAATAERLVNDGYTVYGVARRLDKMESLKTLGVKIMAMDVTIDASMVSGIEEIIANEGRIDVLVNNAGYGAYGAVEDVPIAEAKRQFEVNVFGLARLVQLVLPTMRSQKSGTIINVSSIGGKIGEPHGAWYHATKFAVEGFSDSLRMELKQFGINVVVVQPGAIVTEWNQIARDHLMEASGETAYQNLAKKHVNLLAKADEWGSSPDVIAKGIAKAAKARRPKTRYAIGGAAKPILFMRKILSDRMFDRVMLAQMK